MFHSDQGSWKLLLLTLLTAITVELLVLGKQSRAIEAIPKEHEAVFELSGDGKSIGHKPLTLSTKLDRTVLERMVKYARDPEKQVWLTLDGVVPPKADVSIRLFLNAPDADSRTSYRDPSYAGSLSFYGRPTDYSAKPNFGIELDKAILAMDEKSKFGERLTITMFAAPLRDGENVKSAVSIPFDSVSIRLRETEQLFAPKAAELPNR